MDSHLAQLRNAGAPEHVIQGEIERNENLLERTKDFLVAPVNWPIVQVFCSCMGAVSANGYIPTTEIESEMRIARVPVADRLNFKHCVRLIEQGYLENLPRGKSPVRNSTSHQR